MFPAKKIALRAYNERTDFDEYYKWINDKAVTAYMDDMYPVTYEHAKKQMRALSSPDLDNVVFIIEANKEPVGITGLYDINDVHRRARTRTMIGEREKFNRGYGTESKILLLSYAFYTINLHHITSIVQEQNIASIKSLEKVGYVREGLLRENSFYKGDWVNDIVFGITETDFAPVWEKYDESFK